MPTPSNLRPMPVTVPAAPLPADSASTVAAPATKPRAVDTLGAGVPHVSPWRSPAVSPMCLLPLDASARSRASSSASGAALVPAWRANIEPLLTRQDIDARVQELGASITRDYASKCDAGIVMMGVLIGACPFYTDLCRRIDLPLAYDFVRLASYGAGHKSSGEVKMKIAPSLDVRGKHVIVVEDIVDTGLSMQTLLAYLRRAQPASVEVCTLLTKPSRMQVPIDAKYVGFEVPNQFVVGYGLDDDGRYRNLPFVGVLNTSL